MFKVKASFKMLVIRQVSVFNFFVIQEILNFHFEI